MGVDTPSRLPIIMTVILLALQRYDIAVIDSQLSMIYIGRWEKRTGTGKCG